MTVINRSKNHRKSFGQHFLVEKTVKDIIVDLTLYQLQASGCLRLLEIGPGLGALTELFLEQLGEVRFDVVEKDFKLFDRLQERKISQVGQKVRCSYHLYCQDALDLDAAFFSSSCGVVSNLPYSSGTQILLQLSQMESISFMVLMFQREVAQRIVADIGDSNRSSLSIFIQNNWIVRSVTQVSPEAFRPQPKVWSEVLLFQRRPACLILGTKDSPVWSKMLSDLFRFPRKMLRSVPLPFDEVQIDSSKRPSYLDWGDLERLFVVLTKESEKFKEL